MKQILITGVNSYIGNAVERYLLEYNAAEGRECYRMTKISLREEGWQEMSFRGYDAILHVAGKAHADVGNLSEEEKAAYYRINRDLTVEAAQKAKADGVPQFIYLSSVIVYGDSAPVGGRKHITAETQPNPANCYGDSKLQAEQRLRELEDENFRVAVVRPPMIYGRGSKGNFPLLVKLARKLPVFPGIFNERSMLYIEHLEEFLRLLTEEGCGGLFWPQNPSYVRTADMVRQIAVTCKKRMWICRWMNPFVCLGSKMPGKIGGLVNKAFGSLTIDQSLSQVPFGTYCKCSLEESIQKSVEETI